MITHEVIKSTYKDGSPSNVGVLYLNGKLLKIFPSLKGQSKIDVMRKMVQYKDTTQIFYAKKTNAFIVKDNDGERLIKTAL